MTMYPICPIRPSLVPFGPVWPHLVPLDPVWPVWSCLARFARFCSKKYIFKDNLKKEDNPQKEEYPNNVPKNGDYQKHEDKPKNAEHKAPESKTTQKIEKKNKVNPKIEDCLKVKTYLYCRSTYDFSTWLPQQEWP